MDNPHGHPCPSIFVSDLFYLIVFCHGEIDALQFRIFIPISISLTVRCVIAQLLFDADKLVVLSHTVGTAHRTRLDLS